MNRIHYYSSICIFLFVTACKKGVQPEMAQFNENCSCATEVTADFLMEELATPINWPNTKKQTNTDTMYAGRNVRFFALEPSANYTWTIGAETITGREFYRHFDESLIGQTLEMKLIVNKVPNNICFPNDDGIDTLIRQLTVVDKPTTYEFHATHNPRFEGTFRMKEANATDSIDIVFEINDTPEIWAYKITNYDGMGSEITQQSHGGHNYRQIWFGGTFFAFGHLFNKIDGEIELSMIPNSLAPAEYKRYLYTGRKLN